MKFIFLISRIFIGLVFLFSGFVKAIDPFGSAIKFSEYFEAFHIDFLAFAALPLAILLSATELMIGLNLLAGLRLRFTAWLLLVFMSYFTLLTLVLAFTNPVSDCGCFGDALKLTNWQTFGKNIILFLPTLVVFFYRKNAAGFSTAPVEWSLVAVNFILACLTSVYCIAHQPLLDFRPYKAGTHIPSGMVIPDGAPVAEYETILVYEKDGLRQEFTDKNFPWQDSTWKWVETRQNLIKKGFEPPIHDFSITTMEANDITDQVLQDSGYTLLIIAPDLAKASQKGMLMLNSLALRCNELGFGVFALTSSANSDIEAFRNDFQPAFEICTADETTLETIIRANPGAMLLKEGTILGKWNYRDTPGVNEFQNNMLPVILDLSRRSDEWFSVVLVALVVSLFYCIVFRFTRHAGNHA